MPRQNGLIGTLTVSAILGAQLYAASQRSTPTPPVAFEVASVKPNVSGDPAATIGTQPGGRYFAINVKARDLVAAAYGRQPYQVVGGPSWLDADRFDVNAKASADQPLTPGTPGGPPSATQLMVRALLAERFSLVSHEEKREMPMFHLVRARADGSFGSGVRPSTADCSIPQAPVPTGQRSPCGVRLGPGLLSAGSRTMAALASLLSQFVQRTVADHTEVSGRFDFDLSWAPDVPGNLPPETGPGIFTAVQEQLGLKLQPARGPFDVLVVDSIERPTRD
jgi:uncharacterized protein (TIGR03435 family)